MSLHILCRIHCLPSETQTFSEAISVAMADLGIGIQFGAFEDDEKAMLLAEGYSWPSGIEFQLTDSHDRSDATHLWNESMEECRKEVMNTLGLDLSTMAASDAESLVLPETYYVSAAQTRLGRAFKFIVNQQNRMGGILSCVDIGFEEVEFCKTDHCLENSLKLLLLPWDCLPNTAYIWAS